MTEIQSAFLGVAVGGYISFTASMLASLLLGGGYSFRESLKIALFLWPFRVYEELRNR